MEFTPKKLLAAAAVTGFLAVGGVSIASAQTEEDPTTTTVPEEGTTTVPEDGTAPADDGRPGCDRDGDGVADDGSTDTTEETTEAPAAASAL